MRFNTTAPYRENAMRNVTVNELDACLTELNKILANMDKRIAELEAKAAKPAPARKSTAKKVSE